MDVGHVQGMLDHLHHSLRFMKWRLKLSARNRLAFDITALYTGMRSMVMVDYGGLMPQLKLQLCELLSLLSKVFNEAICLRVLTIEDNAYLVHPQRLQEYIHRTLTVPSLLKFVILDEGVARLAVLKEEEATLKHFESFKNKLSDIFMHDTFLLGENDLQRNGEPTISEVFEHVGYPDLGTFEWSSELTLPTLNGWLLGYPIIYLFKKENISQAARLLCSSSLHLFRVLIQCNYLKIGWISSGSVPDETWELMSFTVPSELSFLGVQEPWLQAFLHGIKQKLHHAPELWRSVNLEMSMQTCRAIAL